MDPSFDVILDCYTDEHSGYGVPPFLNTHPRYLAGALSLTGRRVFYLTIDDLRYANANVTTTREHFSRKDIRNTTRNRDIAQSLLSTAETVFVLMGQFVDYEYSSALPPRPTEVEQLIAAAPGKKVLIYVLSTMEEGGFRIGRAFKPGLFSAFTTHPAHEFVLGKSVSYHELHEIAVRGAAIVSQLSNLAVVEIETGRGCNWKPGCAFCVETALRLQPQYRTPESIIAEVGALYSQGARFFRLGRQPNLFDYMDGDPSSMERLLRGIRETCPEIQTLHVDNTSPQDVVTTSGREIARLIATYCTSGNIGSFGVESFDPEVRQKNRLNGTVDQIIEAIEVFNEVGGTRGPDGLPIFLPGLNLIYGLNGQTERTLETNLLYLRKILDSGLMTRRTFIRGLTDMTGYLTEDSKQFLRRKGEGLAHWQEMIEKEFVIPMLQRVAPKGAVIRNARAELWTERGTIFRQMATCAIRLELHGEFVEPNSFRDLDVVDHIGPKAVLARVAM